MPAAPSMANCSLRIMCMSSKPASTLPADRTDVEPSTGLVTSAPVLFFRGPWRSGPAMLKKEPTRLSSESVYNLSYSRLRVAQATTLNRGKFGNAELDHVRPYFGVLQKQLEEMSTNVL